MSQPFEIQFDFPLAPDLIIALKATAELHHSDPYYKIDNIFVEGHDTEHPALPEFEIKQVEQDSTLTCVHCDSEKESLLSIAAGKAIEKALAGIGS